MQPPKRALCLQDLCCIGRCSLSVIIPALSAMGVQACALPTALLSTHTGGFGEVSLLDSTSLVEEALGHFDRLHFSFDAVFSGYLANPAQAALVLRAFERDSAALHICDPVMGDEGRIYVKEEVQAVVHRLVARADVITPNATESAVLLGLPAQDTSFTEESARERVLQLSALGPSVILTGADVDGQKACVGCVRETKEVFFIPCRYVPQKYPGTGDLFAAVLTGSLLRGLSFEKSCFTAAAFVEKAAWLTYESGGVAREGLYLEALLCDLLSI